MLFIIHEKRTDEYRYRRLTLHKGKDFTEIRIIPLLIEPFYGYVYLQVVYLDVA